MAQSSQDIRKKFLDFFASKQHELVKSSSLLPLNDPTLFFVNAGMVQFKDTFTGTEKRDYSRATTSQKCMRVSGKHNDLENVGRTPRHHTFFEMLGNFSFGDYFKKEAISFAWEFLTEVMELPKDYLWITIFEDDDEAGDIWFEQENVPRNRIVKCGAKDNFWSMGDTGPCGPCSEIHIDLGAYFEGKPSSGNPVSHEEDFMELWNLVFMQFDRDVDGNLNPLPKPSIDTGMGLERLAAIVQKKRTNYDTDLFIPLIESIAEKVGKKYGKDSESDVSLRVVADHIRATAFLISDGVQPSNEGRGYVLRRIMRRAIRHGRLLGMEKPFFSELVEPLIEVMGDAYSELKQNQDFIQKVILREEESFLETLGNGLKIIEDEVARLKSTQKKVFGGELAFKLYDTFGFPLDLTEIIANEHGFEVDQEKFDEEMQAQKERARKAWKGSGEEKISQLYHDLANQGVRTEFSYSDLEVEGKILAILKCGELVDDVSEGDEVEVFVDSTSFYGESGGQAGDKGIIFSDTNQIKISDTQKPVDGVISHIGKVINGKFKKGDQVRLKVFDETRFPTMVNHTATHLLHAALQNILGSHVKQAGSLVNESRLRFDFSHFEALTSDEIEKIEKEINQVIQTNYEVTKEELDYDEAIARGATAFFGDKYGDKVRVVTIGPYSMELCGGTHLQASGQIGAFKIISESSVASGVRRIEAITGEKALQSFQLDRKQLQLIAREMKSTPDETPEKIKKLIRQVKDLEKQISDLKAKLASGGGSGKNYLDEVDEINGVKVLAIQIDIDDAQALASLSDQLRDKLGSGITAVGANISGKASVIITVSKDLNSKYKAGNLIKEISPLFEGRGGGRPDRAQAGGTHPDGIAQAFKQMKEIIQEAS